MYGPPTGNPVLAMAHVPAPAARVTVQVADPPLTDTRTVSPFGTASPWVATTVTLNVDDPSFPYVADVGDTDTVVVVASCETFWFTVFEVDPR